MGRVIRSGATGFAWERVMRSSASRPSEEAVARLREELRARIEDRRWALDAEFTVVEALVRMGHLDAAAHALEDQRLAVRALTMDLRSVIADAAAEETAERALEAWRSLPLTAAVPQSRNRAGHGSFSRPRLALTLAAAMLGLILVPGLREQPMQLLSALQANQAHKERAAWSEIHAARERLATLEPTHADADLVAAETRAAHDRILSFPDSTLESKALRAEIRGLLVEQSGALRELQDNADAKSLLGEVRALSASLGLEVPETRIQPPRPANEVPLPPALEQAPAQPAPEHLAPQPDKPVTDLPLREQRAPAPPKPGGLDVHRADQAPAYPRAPTSATKPSL